MSAAAMRVAYALMSASTEIANAVGSRIYPNVIPEDVAVPAIEYHRAGTFRDPPIGVDGGTGLVEARIAVTAFSLTYSGLSALGESIRAAMQYESGLIAGVQVVAVLGPDEGEDGYSAETGQHVSTAEFTIRHYE